mmetsp:Transcript_18712/g.60112  ORF Transcript_18712/g.60112 Transcript_18712/m.60112 type:complete len:442 (-) Transcript_18712:91-1416(-)
METARTPCRRCANVCVSHMAHGGRGGGGGGGGGGGSGSGGVGGRALPPPAHALPTLTDGAPQPVAPAADAAPAPSPPSGFAAQDPAVVGFEEASDDAPAPIPVPAAPAPKPSQGRESEARQAPIQQPSEEAAEARLSPKDAETLQMLRSEMLAERELAGGAGVRKWYKALEFETQRVLDPHLSEEEKAEIAAGSKGFMRVAAAVPGKGGDGASGMLRGSAATGAFEQRHAGELAEGLGRFGALFDGDMAREARKANKKERRMLERQQKESAGGGSGGGEGEELLEMELAKAHSTAQPERVRKEKKAKRLSRQEIDGMGLRQLKAALKERGYSEAATKFSNLPDEAKKLREFAKSKSAICLQPTAELEREEDAVLAAALAEKKGLLERLTDKVEEMVYGSARDPAKEAQAARKKKIKELKQDRERERQKQREKERELLYGVA